MFEKQTQKLFIQIIDATLTLALNDFGFDELRVGQFRSCFIAHLKDVIASTIAIYSHEPIKKYD